MSSKPVVTIPPSPTQLYKQAWSWKKLEGRRVMMRRRRWCKEDLVLSHCNVPGSSSSSQIISSGPSLGDRGASDAVMSTCSACRSFSLQL
ncbi:hypothetical protein GDO81_000573 [Engystomops pustulosus]|uniref:Uncharacterized protein n=1 Tax=Engystomops pustulosus TaxID=76066 RepID=A0AAV7D7H5_ENGPU|nr:hypothetical protein GDO81_000573 [Engystomops pustulosus]